MCSRASSGEMTSSDASVDPTEARKGAPVYTGRALGLTLDDGYPRPVGLARLSRGSVAPRSLVAVAPAVGPGHRPA